MTTLDERWKAPRLHLARAVDGTGLTARIEDQMDHDCSVVFEKPDGQSFSKRHVDIGILEDQSSPKLQAIIAEAKTILGVMTVYRGFKYKLSARADGQCDIEIWSADANPRAVAIWRHTAATGQAAESAARDWINRQPR